MRSLLRCLGRVGGKKPVGSGAPASHVQALEPRRLFAGDPLTAGIDCQPVAAPAAVEQQSGVLGSSSVSGIDLVGEVFGLRPSVLRGKKDELSVQVMNIGDQRAVGPLGVRLLLSTDQFADSSDIVLDGRVRKVGIKGGDSRFIGVKFFWPENIPNGSYEVIAEIDTQNAITEIDENNAFLAPQPVLIADPFVNLVVEVPTPPPPTVVIGTPFDITVNVRNIGNVKAKGERMVTILVASTDAFPGSADHLLEQFSKRDLNLHPGKQFSIRFKFTIDATLEDGTWFLGASTDSTNVITESSDIDNGGVAPSQFTRIPF